MDTPDTPVITPAPVTNNKLLISTKLFFVCCGLVILSAVIIAIMGIITIRTRNTPNTALNERLAHRDSVIAANNRTIAAYEIVVKTKDEELAIRDKEIERIDRTLQALNDRSIKINQAHEKIPSTVRNLSKDSLRSEILNYH